jgi:small-conductance mechanosensitive channel
MKVITMIAGSIVFMLFVFDQSHLFASPPRSGPVVVSVQMDSTELYRCVATDSASAAEEADHILQIMKKMRSMATHPEKLQLREQDGNGILYMDSSSVLIVKSENRVKPAMSPLANAVIIRNWLIAHADVSQWDEEELILRLLLGIVFPFSLLVILRLTRLGIRNWEQEWRHSVLQWFIKKASQRGMMSADRQGKRFIRFLLGVERLTIFASIVTLASLGWFTLFPQTRHLAASLIVQIVGPALSLLGDAAHALLLLSYTIAILFLARWIGHRLEQQKKMSKLPMILQVPLLYIPIRLIIWIMALFLILFPYPGAPRMFAMGVLLLALFIALLALRPIIEEISSGIWLGNQYRFKVGDRFRLEDREYTIVNFHLVHLQVDCQKQIRYLPYSMMIKSELTILKDSAQNHARLHKK